MEIVHFDLADREIKEGDRVAYNTAISRHLRLGTVSHFTPKKVFIFTEEGGRSPRYPHHLVIIEG